MKFFFIAVILLGLIPAAIAAIKGRSFLLWWFYGTILFIVALPMAIFIKKRNSSDIRKGKEITIPFKYCRHCFKEITLQYSASCPSCGKKLHPCSLCKVKDADLYSGKEHGYVCRKCNEDLKDGTLVKTVEILCPVCQHVQVKEQQCSNCGVDFSKVKFNCPACGESQS